VPVAVVCDSAASLGAALAARWGVVVVPMQLEVGGEPLSEEEMSLDDLVANLPDGVKTSGPPPGAFVQAITGVASGDGVVVLTVGQRFSSTFQSAQSAAGLVEGTDPVRVVDTATAAGAEGLVVLAAAEAARAGASVDDVAAVAESVAGRVRLVAAVEDLTSLVRGGRLPASAARAGVHLGVRVLFELRASGPRPLRPSLSAGGAFDQLVAQWRRSIIPGARLHVAALHALRPEEAEQLLAAVRQEVEPASSFVGTFGQVMVAHTGPGVIGLAWWWQEPGDRPLTSAPTPS
jgi:DegV family protein with EDD domain